jgi:hypothetical protein
MMTSGVHIKDIDRQDFFAIDDDDSLFMPGRERVPPLTVIHVASLRVTEDELIERLSEQRPESWERSDDSCCNRRDSHAAIGDELRRTVERWTADSDSKYEKLRSIVEHLRSEFVFDRAAESDSISPVHAFLSEKRGGDHLFATTAVLMAREIGLPSRLVTGFYVRPSSAGISAGHHDVMPEDVHVWAEIQLDHHRWFEIEPTPGYRPPVYRPSWWLLSRRFAARHWSSLLGVAAFLGVVFLSRLVWIDWCLASLWWISLPLGARHRVRMAMRIIEFRARMLRHSRPACLPPRTWLLDELFTPKNSDGQLRELIESFCDLADRVCFRCGKTEGVQTVQLQTIGKVVSSLPIARLKQHLREQHG